MNALTFEDTPRMLWREFKKSKKVRDADHHYLYLYTD